MIDVIKSKNILWVDIAKFIAMFLVVLEHVVLAFKMQDSEVIGYIRNVIVTFHMPVFIIAKNTLFLIFFQSLFLFITKWIKLYDLMNDIPHTSIKLLFVIFYSFFIYVISYYIILLIEKCKLEILLGKKFISKGNVK